MSINIFKQFANSIGRSSKSNQKKVYDEIMSNKQNQKLFQTRYGKNQTFQSARYIQNMIDEYIVKGRWNNFASDELNEMFNKPTNSFKGNMIDEYEKINGNGSFVDLLSKTKKKMDILTEMYDIFTSEYDDYDSQDIYDFYSENMNDILDSSDRDIFFELMRKW